MQALLLQRNSLNSLPAIRGMSGMGSHEIKGMDVSSEIYQFNTADGASNNMVYLMNGIQVGDSFFRREGNKIQMKNIHIRGYLRPRHNHPGGGSAEDYFSAPGMVRMLVIYDRGPQQALPTLSTILRGHTTGGSTSTDIDSEINLNERARFAILRDKMWSIPSFQFNITNKYGLAPTSTPEGNDWVVNEFIKLKNLGVVYRGSDSPMTVEHISTGAVYLILIRSGDDLHMQANLGWRIRYEDQ